MTVTALTPITGGYSRVTATAQIDRGGSRLRR